MSNLLDRSEQILGIGPWGDYAYEAEIYLTPKGVLKLHGPDGWIAKSCWEPDMGLGGYFIVILGNQYLTDLAYRGDKIPSYTELAARLKHDFPALYLDAVRYIQKYTGDIEAGHDFEPETLTALRAAFI